MPSRRIFWQVQFQHAIVVLRLRRRFIDILRQRECAIDLCVVPLGMHYLFALLLKNGDGRSTPLAAIFAWGNVFQALPGPHEPAGMPRDKLVRPRRKDRRRQIARISRNSVSLARSEGNAALQTSLRTGFPVARPAPWLDRAPAFVRSSEGLRRLLPQLPETDAFPAHGIAQSSIIRSSRRVRRKNK